MSEWDRRQLGADEDDLDKVIRHSLELSTPRAKPSEDVWERIRQQVEAGPAPRHRQPPARRFRLMLGPMLQGVAAVALLLLGFSLTSRLWVESYEFGSRTRATQQATEPTTELVVEDAVTVVNQPASALNLSNDDMMNQGAVLRSLHQQELLVQVMAETSDPRQDPSLVRRHELRRSTDQVSVSAFVWDLMSPNSRVLYGSK